MFIINYASFFGRRRVGDSGMVGGSIFLSDRAPVQEFRGLQVVYKLEVSNLQVLYLSISFKGRCAAALTSAKDLRADRGGRGISTRGGPNGRVDPLIWKPRTVHLRPSRFHHAPLCLTRGHGSLGLQSYLLRRWDGGGFGGSKSLRRRSLEV